MNGMKEASGNVVALDFIFPLLLIVHFVKGIAQSYEVSLGHCSFRLNLSRALHTLYYT